MADLHKLTVQEAMNASGSGGGWTVNPISATHGSTANGATIQVDISGAGQVGIYAGADLYFRFSSGGGQDCVQNNDLIIPAETLTFITVPRALGPTIYFNHLGVTPCTVRIVEV